MTLDRDSQRLDELIAFEQDRFVDRMGRSTELARAAHRSLAGGATSSWQLTDPHPIWIDHGKGSRLFDVDGHELVDLHGGYGVMLAGHAHPAIAEAVRGQIAHGSHFAQPVEEAVVVADHLRADYRQPLWRFGNSGTESTMDAVHLMRAATGRDLVIKFEGAYHGHHDMLQVSTWLTDTAVLGAPDRPRSVVASPGIPDAVASLTLVAPFNDLDAVEALLVAHAGKVAGVITEPVLMNCGVVPPEPGFLEGLRRLTNEHGVLLTFDEVKTGLTAGRGGCTARYGVTPDLVCLAKSLGGGLPISAIGGSEDVMSLIVNGAYEQVGTFNGNPLSIAAARAMLEEVMTDEAYRHLGDMQMAMAEGAQAIIHEYALPAYVADVGAKGSITYRESPVRNYRDFLAVDGRWAYAAWLTQINRGVLLPPWGKGEQWLLSVQHTAEDVDLYLETLAVFAQAVRG